MAADASYVADFCHKTRVRSRVEFIPFGQYLQVFRLGFSHPRLSVLRAVEHAPQNTHRVSRGGRITRVLGHRPERRHVHDRELRAAGSKYSRSSVSSRSEIGTRATTKQLRLSSTAPFTGPRRTTLISQKRAARGSVCNGVLFLVSFVARL